MCWPRTWHGPVEVDHTRVVRGPGGAVRNEEAMLMLRSKRRVLARWPQPDSSWLNHPYGGNTPPSDPLSDQAGLLTRSPPH